MSWIAHHRGDDLHYRSLMSERSTHLRALAAKCLAHARALNDDITQDELRRMAREYTAEAAAVKSKEH